MGWLRLMNKINSFFKLQNYKKILLVKSLILIIFIRIFLYTFSFSTVKNISKKISKPNNNYKDKISIDDIVWAVQNMSIYVPRATCLTKAITGQIIFSKYNYHSKLKIGVKKNNYFEAHAWLEIDGKPVLGKSEQKYVPIWESKIKI